MKTLILGEIEPVSGKVIFVMGEYSDEDAVTITAESDRLFDEYAAAHPDNRASKWWVIRQRRR